MAGSAVIESHLDAQLALLTDGIRDALARAATSEDDPSILLHTRSSEFANAINLAKTSGELVLAMAKLNGRFNHDINVRRVSADPPPPSED
jgi:hypothetical protein